MAAEAAARRRYGARIRPLVQRLADPKVRFVVPTGDVVRERSDHLHPGGVGTERIQSEGALYVVDRDIRLSQPDWI